MELWCAPVHPPFWLHALPWPKREKNTCKGVPGKFSFKARTWKGVSDEAKELICNLLEKNPQDRYTARMSLEHIWLSDQAPRITCKSPTSDTKNNYNGCLLDENIRNAALNILANDFIDGAITNLQQVFGTLDTSGKTFTEPKDVQKRTLDSPVELEDVSWEAKTCCNAVKASFAHWSADALNVTNEYTSTSSSYWL